MNRMDAQPEPRPEGMPGAAVLMVVSDATGRTARRALEAALAQFPGVPVDIRQIGQVRAFSAIESVVEEARVLKAAVVHTLVLPDARHHMYEAARRHGVRAIDLMGPLLVHLQAALARAPAGRPGSLDHESAERAEAMNFTVKHDDGQRAGDLPAADAVLVGPSRVSKTPLSVYMSYFGWRVANVPILLNVSPPEALFAVDRARVVGLTASVTDLLSRRRARVQRLGVEVSEYTDQPTIRRELALLQDICRRHDWQVVNVSGRAIEETAVEILDLLGHRGPDPA